MVANWWGGMERGKAFGFYVFAAGCSSVLIYLLSIIMLDIYEVDWRWLFRLPVLLLLLGCGVFISWLGINRKMLVLNPLWMTWRLFCPKKMKALWNGTKRFFVTKIHIGMYLYWLSKYGKIRASGLGASLLFGNKIK